MPMTKARREKKNSYKLLKKQTQEKQLPKLKKEVLKLLNKKIKDCPDTIEKDNYLLLLQKVNMEDNLSFKQLKAIEKDIKE